MSSGKRIYSRFLGTGSYLPDRILTNLDLEKMIETSDEWIITRTGIRERRLAAEGDATSDLSTRAAERALEMAGVRARDLDMIIVATLTPDMLIPSTACVVQHNLGANGCAAMDLEAACTGFIYAVSTADQFIRSGMMKKVLVIGAEKLSPWIDWEDRGTCVIFGDGAGAAVLGVDESPGVLSSHLFADGSMGDWLTIPAGGSRLPVTEEVIRQRMDKIKMAGNETFKVAVKGMMEAATAALEANDLKTDDVDLLIPHQANTRIIEATAKKLGLPMERVMVNIDRCGNTSAGTVPIALDEAVREGRIKEGDHVLLDAFGAGFTWGSAMIKW